MSISTYCRFPVQFNNIKEAVLSNKQILAGLAMQALGLVLQKGETFAGNPGSLERKIGTLGFVVEVVGLMVTGCSKEQTYSKASAFLIAGYAIVIAGVAFAIIHRDANSEKIGTICVMAGASLIYSGLLACKTVDEMNAERQNPENQPFVDLETNSLTYQGAIEEF